MRWLLYSALVVAVVSDVVDEIAVRRAREGGRVGDVTVTLIWNDESDLDLHVFVPTGTSTGGEEEICYKNKKSRSGAAHLDVDMNVRAPFSVAPVENVYAGSTDRGVS